MSSHEENTKGSRYIIEKIKVKCVYKNVLKEKEENRMKIKCFLSMFCIFFFYF